MVAKIVAAKPGTMNAWIARGYIPGLIVGTSGKRRDIDAETATRIAVFAEIVGFGVSPDQASSVIQSMEKRHLKGGWMIVPKPPAQGERVPMIYDPSPDPGGSLQRWAGAPDPPAGWLVINVARLAARVAAAEEEWNRSREAKA